jgi:hypothetical protein
MIQISLSEESAKDLLRAIRYGELAISCKENQEGVGDRIRSNLAGVRDQIEQGTEA